MLKNLGELGVGTAAAVLLTLIHSAIVPCQLHIARSLLGLETPEMTGADNLKTLRLVFSAYDSARLNQVVDKTLLHP